MSRILYILIAILMLGFIVTVHEFGHYLLGRLCGIGIVEFSVGMGPKIAGFKRKGIAYSLRAIPLGGYCSFVGEDESNPAPNAINNQPVWKRIVTVAAGPLMNFLLAFVFCTILLSCFLVAEYQPRIVQVTEGSPAAECGVEVGDIVTGVNGLAISYDGAGMEAARSAIMNSDLNMPLELTLDRGGEQIEVSVRPESVIDAEGNARTQLGIAFGGRTFTLGEALGRACGFMVDFTKETLAALKNLIFHGEGMEGMMGPVGIVSFVSVQIANDTLYTILNLTFVLSLSVGIMNLLPLPALDGGRLVFLIIEGVRRKPIPAEKEGMVHAIGLGLLLLLFAFITYKDIVRLIVS